MADVSAHFTVYKGNTPGDLAHVATVLGKVILGCFTTCKTATVQ